MEKTINGKLESPEALLKLYSNVQKTQHRARLHYVRNIIGEKAALLLRWVDTFSKWNGVRTKELLGNLRHELAQIRVLHESMNEPFSIFIMGMGNYGKSSLINALIEDRKAEIDFLPKTWKIDIFQYKKDENRILLRFNDGSLSKMVPEEEARRLFSEEERKCSEARKTITGELIKIQEQYRHDPEKLNDIKSDLERKYIYRSNIIESVWPCKKNRVLNNFILVDTPGLKQELLAEDIRTNLLDYYNKADGVIWILDAATLSKKASFEQMEGAVVEASGSKKIIGVLNKMDKVNDEDKQKVLAKAYEIFGDRLQKIIPISAQGALDGVLNKDEARILQSGYYDLLEVVETRFLKEAFKIKADSKFQGLRRYCQNVDSLLKVYSEDLDRDLDKNLKTKKGFEQDLNDLICRSEGTVSVKLDDYKKKVAKNINDYANLLLNYNNKSPRSEIEGFLRNKIFEEHELSSLIKAIIDSEYREMQKTIYFWSNKSVISEYKILSSDYHFSIKVDKENNFDLGDIAEDLKWNISFYNYIPDNFLDSIFYKILKTLASFMNDILGLSSPLEDMQSDLNKTLDQMVNKLKVDIIENIKEMGQRSSLKLEEIRNESFAHVYCGINEVDALRNALHLEGINQLKLPNINLNEILSSILREQ